MVKTRNFNASLHLITSQYIFRIKLKISNKKNSTVMIFLFRPVLSLEEKLSFKTNIHTLDIGQRLMDVLRGYIHDKWSEKHCSAK